MMTLALAAMALGAWQNPPSNAALLGLQLNVTVNGGVQELFDSAKEERGMGCGLIAFSLKWKDLEPTPGHFEEMKLKQELDWRGQLGFDSYITIQTIDTNQRTLPQELMNEPWDSPTMLRRESALLHWMAKLLPKSVKAVMLGNEVDGYLAAHRQELSPYLSFLSAGRQVLRSERPGLPVGVTTMFLSLENEGPMLERLQAPMDIVSMTYYPMQGVSRVRPPSEVGRDFDQMVRFAGKRPLFLQEAGYPASTAIGSSEEAQAQFVDKLFDSMEKHRTKLAGVCYFLSIDFNDKLVDELVRYYGVGAENFRAFLATLGLKKQDGTPRKAWDVFKQRAKKFVARQP